VKKNKDKCHISVGGLDYELNNFLNKDLFKSLGEKTIEVKLRITKYKGLYVHEYFKVKD